MLDACLNESVGRMEAGVEALPHDLRTISAGLLAQQSGFVWIGSGLSEEAMQRASRGNGVSRPAGLTRRRPLRMRNE
jgi:hypothetical protein